MTSIEEQLVDLQTRIAYQDETLTQLNDVVSSQQREIDRLRVAVANLSRLVGDDANGRASHPGVEEPPPHY